MNELIRPRTIGEVLDSAVSLVARDATLLIAILMIVNVPLLALRMIMIPNSTTFITDVQFAFHLPHDTQAMQQALEDMNAGKDLPLLFLCAFVLAPLAWLAFTFATWRLLIGAPVDLPDAYQRALRRWFPALIVDFAFLLIVIGCFAGVAFTIFPLVNAITAGLIAIGSPLAGVVQTLLTILVFVLILASLGLFLVAWQLAFIFVATEDGDPFRAIGVGLGRTFAPRMRWRSMLVGIVTMVIAFLGSLALTAVGGWLAFITHIDVLHVIFAGFGNLVVNGLISAYLVAYALDVRVRREGFRAS